MNYLQALKTAQDYFGHEAMAIRGDDITPLSELIEQAETSPVASGSFNIEVSLQTGGQLTSSAGAQIPAWAITEAAPAAQFNSDDEETEPMLIIISGEDLPG